MSTFCENGAYDLPRGIALAQTAYDRRAGNDRLGLEAADRKRPPLLKAKFVVPGYDDTTLVEYGRDELDAAAAGKPDEQLSEPGEG
jgi:hypothetical protein